MSIEDARVRCREYVKLGMRKHHAEAALIREGVDESIVREALNEYDKMWAAFKLRQRRLIQLWGAILLFGSTGVLVYYAFFYTVGLIHWWLCAPAMYGLLKILLPTPGISFSFRGK